MTIETRGLTKRYGRTLAVDDLSLAIRPGQVTGFVGPNGAGKTTTMQLLLGLAAADAGEALVAGRRYASIERPLTVVGALLDAGAVHPSRSARSHLRWLARSNRIPLDRVDRVLHLVGLSGVRRRRARALSLGMRQRLGVAAALLGDPPILILDEPTIGLDPEGIQWMRETLRDLASDGRTVFVSSHLMSELEGTADHLIVIGRGRLLADLSVAELIAAASDDRVEAQTPEAPAAMTVLANAGATVISNGRDRVAVEGMPAAQVAVLLASHGVRLDGLLSTRATLEEAYFQLTRGAAEHVSGARPTGEPAVVTATLRSEWLKLRTQRGTIVALATTGVLMVGMTAFFAAESETNAVVSGDDDVVQNALTGIVFAQIAVVVAGASLITGEFGTGMIRTTFTATQSRLRVLLAKALVLSLVTFPLALVTSIAAFLVAQPLLRDGGYVTPAYPPRVADGSRRPARRRRHRAAAHGLRLARARRRRDPAALGRDDRHEHRADLSPVPLPRRVPRAHPHEDRAAHATGGDGDPVDNRPHAGPVRRARGHADRPVAGSRGRVRLGPRRARSRLRVAARQRHLNRVRDVRAEPPVSAIDTLYRS